MEGRKVTQHFRSEGRAGKRPKGRKTGKREGSEE